MSAAAELELWCDGSGTTDENPCGAGVVAVYGSEVLAEVSRALDHGTNNIAECWAIGLGLALAVELRPILPAGVPVRVLSDSQFAIGACAPGSTWQIRGERLAALAARVRATAAGLEPLAFQHVRGHSGLVYNERADALAGGAREERVHMLACGARPAALPRRSALARRSEGRLL